MQVFCKSFQRGGGVKRIGDNPIYMNQNFGITWSNFFFFDLFSRNHFQSNRHRRTPTVGLASLIETDLGAFPAMSDKYHQCEIVSRKDERA